MMTSAMTKRLAPIADYFRALDGWKACFVAFALGVCFTAAFPPLWLLPLAVVAFSGLMWQLQGAATARKAFNIGWWFGFGHHTTGLYWICIALGVDGGAFIWLMPFTLCLLPAYLSIFIGFGLAFCRRIGRTHTQQVVLFAVVWLAMEYIRANLFYGFPWNLAGYIWTLSDVTLQPAALLGVYGLSLWAVLFCAAFSLLSPQKDDSVRRSFGGFAVIMLMSVAVAGWGALRLNAPDAAPDKQATDVQLRLVQGNVEQSLKWDPEFQKTALQKHISLSRTPSDTPPDYIIWPETAMPYHFESGSRWAQILGSFAPEKGTLITGVVRSQGARETWQVWNSLRAIDSAGRVVTNYDKSVLVPFGEFIPLRDVLSFLPIAKITQGTTDFTRGTGAQLLEIVGKAPLLQPLICYETIFPQYRPTDTAQRAGWLLNITNDAWFGTSSGPYQHLHMSRTRAVERGAPMVRVANTGVSAVFDAYGREIARIALNTQSILDVALPRKTDVPTWYSRYGEFTLIIICYILLIYTFSTSSRKLKENNL